MVRVGARVWLWYVCFEQAIPVSSVVDFVGVCFVDVSQ
jgi:hypothetical protein